MFTVTLLDAGIPFGSFIQKVVFEFPKLAVVIISLILIGQELDFLILHLMSVMAHGFMDTQATYLGAREAVQVLLQVQVIL